jgi:SOS-response transcriptional repressor LexA
MGLPNQQAISYIENKSELTESEILSAAKAFGVSVGVLYGEKPPFQVQEPPSLIILPSSTAGNHISDANANYVAVPIIPGEIAASVGGAVDLRADQVEDHAIIYRAWAPHPEQFCCIKVAEGYMGESMQPTIKPGWILGIDYRHRAAKRYNGRIVACRIDDEGFAIKRAWIQEGQRNKKKYLRMTFTSDAAAQEPDRFPPVIFDNEECNNRIVGLVAWFWGRQE